MVRDIKNNLSLVCKFNVKNFIGTRISLCWGGKKATTQYENITANLRINPKLSLTVKIFSKEKKRHVRITCLMRLSYFFLRYLECVCVWGGGGV